MMKFRMLFTVICVVILSSCAGGTPTTLGSTDANQESAFTEAMVDATAETPDEAAAEPTSEAVYNYQTLSAEEARQQMDELSAYILVDVRTEAEYNESHIEGALLIPVDELEERAETELPDTDAEIFVYCQSGRRSAKAAQTLAGLGYTHINDMGGITAWPYGTTSP